MIKLVKMIKRYILLCNNISLDSIDVKLVLPLDPNLLSLTVLVYYSTLFRSSPSGGIVMCHALEAFIKSAKSIVTISYKINIDKQGRQSSRVD